jgi:hypothetical protein
LIGSWLLAVATGGTGRERMHGEEDTWMRNDGGRRTLSAGQVQSTGESSEDWLGFEWTVTVR